MQKKSDFLEIRPKYREWSRNFLYFSDFRHTCMSFQRLRSKTQFSTKVVKQGARGEV